METTTKKLPNRKWLIAKDGKTIIFKTNVAHGYGWNENENRWNSEMINGTWNFSQYPERWDEVKDPSLVLNAIYKGMESLGIGKESKFIPIFRTLDSRIMYWTSSYSMKDYNFDLNDDFMVKELMEGNLYLKNDKGEYRWVLCRGGFAKIEK